MTKPWHDGSTEQIAASSGGRLSTNTWRPRVTVVIPTLNEEHYIRACLASVYAQTYPQDLIEVIVADGGSTDATRALVEELCLAHSNLRLVDNPERNQAAGLNRAIAVAHGEVIARLDGHSEWRPWHLAHCIDLLESTGADNVGGRMEAMGETPLAQAVACATATPLGVGGARFHYATRQMVTDTVFLGCFRRSALDRVGEFNERYPPHEDYELNYRIRKTGGRVVYSPDIPTTYWARTSWRALARQYFRYGRGKARVARTAPGVLRPHHVAPPLFVVVLLVAIPASMRPRPRLAVFSALAAYAAACAMVGARSGRNHSLDVRATVPFVFPVLHVSWGVGFYAGLIRGVRRRA